MTRVVVVGFGSIGTRHARILSELGCEVAVVSRRTDGIYPLYSNLTTALSKFGPGYVVIANETAAHVETLHCLVDCGYQGLVLVEKPLAVKPLVLPRHRFRRAAVGYNLHFHPLLRALKDALAHEEVMAAQVYCGQYLPDWRAGTDYRSSYSARKDSGGGVLRDLSHEIEYMLWLFGPWRRLTALGGRLSALAIDSDDCWALLAEYERCPIATLHVNYVDRPGRRDIIVNTKVHTYRADFKASTLECDGRLVDLPRPDEDDTYRALHLAILTGDDEEFCCTLEQAVQVTEFISACEVAEARGNWVTS